MSANKKKTNQITAAIIQTAMMVIFVTIMAMVFYAGIKKAYSFGYAIFGSGPVAEPPGTDKVFVVEEGMSTSECLDNLEKSGLIRDKNVALIQELFFEYEIYPGTYTLNTSMSVREILAELNEKPPEETTKAAPETPAPTSTEEETREIIEGDE